MSFKEYLHEKAEESRHNETLAYLTFIGGAVFFVGGVLETLILPGTPQWLLFLPYYSEPRTGAVLGLTLIITGLAMIVFGIASGINYSSDRRWYMRELHKANSLEEVLMQDKSVENTRKKKKNRAQ
jgi:membrane protein implicated in regulation of membrane protease activity